MENDARELFAQLTLLEQDTVTNWLRGMTQRQAYLTAGGESATAAGADVAACTLLNKPKVKRYVALVRSEQHDETIMGRDEMRRRLTVLARTDLKDLVEFSEVETPSGKKQTVWRLRDDVDPLRQAAIAELTFTKMGPKMKTHNALVAMKQLADLDGLEAPKRTELSGPGGKPLATVVFDALDPQEAAKAYADMVRGD